MLTTIGDEAIFKYPVKKDWVAISQDNGQDVTILLPDIHVEVIFFHPHSHFSPFPLYPISFFEGV